MFEVLKVTRFERKRNNKRILKNKCEKIIVIIIEINNVNCDNNNNNCKTNEFTSKTNIYKAANDFNIIIQLIRVKIFNSNVNAVIHKKDMRKKEI
jgi:hypothetical protein